MGHHEYIQALNLYPECFVCCDLSVHLRPPGSVHLGPPTSVDNQKAGHTQHTLILVISSSFIVKITRELEWLRCERELRLGL